MAPSTFLLTGTFYNADNTLATGTVTLTPTARTTPSSTVVDPNPVVAPITAGVLSKTLVATGGSYQCTTQIVGGQAVTFLVPATGANVDLSTITIPSVAPFNPSNWMGVWSASLTYQPGQMVLFAGSSWVALQPSLNSPPATGTVWALMAQGDLTPSYAFGSGNAGVVIIGDSQALLGTLGDGTVFSGSAAYRNSRDVLAWANLLSSGQVGYVRNAGVNGDMISGPPSNVIGPGVAARLATDALAYRPRVVVFQIGRNDIVVLGSLSTFLAGVSSCIKQCVAAGIIPVWMGLYPDNNMTGPQTNMIRVWNQAIARLCRVNNIPFVDNFALVTDPATGLYSGTSGVFFDGSHPSGKAARLIAANLIKTLTPLLPGFQPHLFGDNSAYTNALAMLDNPLFLASTAGVPNGWTATVPSHCTVSVAAASAPVVGNWVQLACDASVATTGVTINRALPGGGWSVGDTIRIACATQFAVPDNGGAPEIVLFRNGAVIDYLSMFPDGGATSTTNNNSFSTGGNPVTFAVDYVIPAGTTSLVLYLELATVAGVAASAWFGQLTTVNLTRNSLLIPSSI